jgi:hypothetical protein
MVATVQHEPVSALRRAQDGCPRDPAEVPRPARGRQARAPAFGRYHLSRYYADRPTNPRSERRSVRMAVRAIASMDPDTAQRQRECGVVTLGGDAVQIRVKDGAYICGTKTCGSIWLCTCCSAKIRATRADDLVRGLDVHYGRDGAVHLLSLTVAHDRGDPLAKLLGVECTAWKKITQGGAWTRLKGSIGLVGWIRAVEITEGDEHGWHPHFHILVLTSGELDAWGISALYEHIYSRWAAVCKRAALRPPDPLHGVDVRPNIAQAGAELGRYVTKVQEGDWGVAQEISRGDLKTGRRGSRVPFEILKDYQDWGEVEDRDLWLEYKAATKGRTAFRWSRGLRKNLLLDEEKTDEEAAQIEANGVLVAVLPRPVWRRVIMARLEIALLEAAEGGGLAAINELLGRRGCGWAHPPGEEVI